MNQTILTLIGGGLSGSLFTYIYQGIKCKMQIMECHYIEDDILSKVPQQNENNTIHKNVYCKTFKVKNTTNRDINKFKVIFQFDQTATILECYSRSKEGYNRQKIRKNKNNPNESHAIIQQFNRGDEIQYVFKIANISDNKYYVTECECVGFKIKCKDKRKSTNKSKSMQSNQILINRNE